MDDLARVGVDTLYLLALINPVSKVSVLTLLWSEDRRRELMALAWRSSLAAAVILLGFMTCGAFILRDVFHVGLDALRVAGGCVLFWVGFHALSRGAFFEFDTHAELSSLAIAPLACPMIAGPAAIVASVTLRLQEGFLAPALAVVAAVAVNHAVMLFAHPISLALKRFNVLGALIRVTGLIVMTIGTQMALEGIGSWMAGVGR
jgi:multiple antibiotic resistance protein